MENALQAINLALTLITRGQELFAAATAAYAKARAEGRDISDAELADLKSQRNKALDDFRAQVGG